MEVDQMTLQTDDDPPRIKISKAELARNKAAKEKARVQWKKKRAQERAAQLEQFLSREPQGRRPHHR